MAKNLLSIEAFNHQLQKWSGQKIRIIKKELDDIDETLLVFDDVSYEKGPRNDDYISDDALHLNGTGVVETTKNNYEELPSGTFEIPIDEDTIYELDGKRFFIRTSRGIYLIEPYDW